MAAITFNTALQADPVLGRLQTALAALREMLNAFVSHRMQLAAAAAEHARPRQVRDATLSAINIR